MRAVALLLGLALGAQAEPVSYAIALSQATAADPAWQSVVAALKDKYPQAATVMWDKEVGETLPGLTKLHPQFVCWVCQPAEVSVVFVRNIHRLTRRLDADPYTDCRWGVLTGLDAADALAIARDNTPLVIRHVVAGTLVPLPPAGTAAKPIKIAFTAKAL